VRLVLLLRHQLLARAVAVVVALLLEGLRARWVEAATAPYNSSLCDRRRSLEFKPVAFATAT
jgi:hypothetical protein